MGRAFEPVAAGRRLARLLGIASVAIVLLGGATGVTLWSNAAQAEQLADNAERKKAQAYAERTCDTLEEALRWNPTRKAIADFHSQLFAEWLWAVSDECPNAYREMMDALPAQA